MPRRSLAVAAAATLAALLPAAALAARVTIRVEGRTQTIFAPVPRALDAATPLQALDAASLAGEFYFHVAATSFGAYVDQIGRFPAAGNAGWAFKVNGATPPVGADQLQLRGGDSLLWYWAEFGPGGGPPTLELSRVRRVGRPACYRIVARDDAGRVLRVSNGRLRVDNRSVRTNLAGIGCPGRHVGLVRATAPGAVRSNALP